MNDHANDPIRPAHYRQHPSGIQPIEVSRHLPGDLAQAFQYLHRAPYRGEHVADLRKAVWFLQDHAANVEAGHSVPDVALSYAIEIMDHESDWRIREAMRLIVIGLNPSDYEAAAQLVEDAIADIRPEERDS